jgi:DNA-binding NtrC family response regulator
MMKQLPIEAAPQVKEDDPQRPTPAAAAESSPDANRENEAPLASLRAVRAQGEIKAILAALEHTSWNRKQAARLLKISYRGLLYKIHQHNLASFADHS